MKLRILSALFLLSILVVSCTAEDENDGFNIHNPRISNEIDRIADDVSILVEQEFLGRQADAGRISSNETSLPVCASVTTTDENGIWTSVIDFGPVGCTLTSGALISGKIIASGSSDFTSETFQVNYTFVDFQYNGRNVAGSRHITFSRQSTTAQTELHLVADMDLDLTVLFPNGKSYVRSGHRIRKQISGYQTPGDWLDNVYQITGSWVTAFPNRDLNATVTDPVIWFGGCPYIGQGKITYNMGSTTALLDYGDGICDYFALLTINAESPETVLLN